MDNTPYINYTIEERSFVSFIKREIHAIAKINFSEKRAAETDIIVSELTSNIIKHARKGELLYRLCKTEANTSLELICIDHGPGIQDLGQMMKDGSSTTRTLGQGLGAIERLSDFSQVYTHPGWGTIVYSRIEKEPLSPAERRKKELQIRAICVAKPGETFCGDGFAVKRRPDETFFFLGDGLGHGEQASIAIHKAIDSFNECRENEPLEILRVMHRDVKRTRGLVGTIAVLDHKSNCWKICGIGNIGTRLYQGLAFKNYTSYNGIIGLNIPNTMQNSENNFDKYQYLVMCSDGIKTRWDISQYPSILKYDPIILAAAIYKDYARKTDDMSVFIARI